MLNDHQKSSALRAELWQRAQGLGGRVRGEVARGTSLSPSDIEDLWADLLIQAVGAPGSPNAMPGDADSWGDAQLAGWLKRALSRDVIDEQRRRFKSDGQSWISGTPLEDLTRVIEAQSIYTTLGSATPEDVVVQRDGLRRATKDLTEVLDLETTRLKVAEAMGADIAQQGRLLGISAAKRRRMQDRFDFALEDLRARRHAVLVWLWPEAAVRWFGGLFGGAGAALLGAGTGTKLAASLALVGATVGGVQAAKPSQAPRAITATLSTTTASAAGSARAPAATVAAATVVGTQRATSIVRAESAAQQRRAAAAQRRRIRLARERRARERADARKRAAERRRRQRQRTVTASAPTVAVPQRPVTRAPSSVPAAPAPSSNGSAAATEFLPNGR